MAQCAKCSALAKHDPVDGVMTACGRHSKANAERSAERMRKLHADPEFAKAHAERMRKLNADPEFNPLAALTEAERADYDVLRTAGYTRAEAFEAMGKVL